MKIDEQALASTVAFAHACATFFCENKQASDMFQSYMFDLHNGSGAWTQLSDDEKIGAHEEHIYSITAAEHTSSGFLHTVIFEAPQTIIPPMQMHMQMIPPEDDDL